MGVLRRAVRKDCGKVSLKPDLIECLVKQYRDYPHWTYQLHYDNLKALVKADEKLGPLQSYSTVRRYMVAQGMLRKPRLKPKERPGELLAAQRRERREIRSYEAEYVGSLWHLDFHHGSLQGGHAPWPVGAAAGFGHPGRSLAVLLLTCSGICPRPPRIWCMGCPRQFRSADCPGP